MPRAKRRQMTYTSHWKSLTARKNRQVKLKVAAAQTHERRGLHLGWCFVFSYSTRQSPPLKNYRHPADRESKVSLPCSQEHDSIQHPHVLFMKSYFNIIVSFMLRSYLYVFPMHATKGNISGLLCLSVCMFQLENCWVGFYEIYSTVGYPFVLFNLLQLLITTWWDGSVSNIFC